MKEAVADGAAEDIPDGTMTRSFFRVSILVKKGCKSRMYPVSPPTST